MRSKLEHILIEQKEFQQTLDALCFVASDRGFREENTLYMTVHSHPDEALTVTQLAEKLNDFFEEKFEFLYMGEYLRNSNNFKASLNNDYRSSSHLHCLIKGRVDEFREYSKEWNKASKLRCNQLFHIEPIVDTIEEAIRYPLKELRKNNGERLEPCGAFVKSPLLKPTFNWHSIFVRAMLHMLSTVLLKALPPLQILSSINVRIIVITVVVSSLMCMLLWPNAPPVRTFDLSVDM